MLVAVAFLIVFGSLYGLIYLKRKKWSFSKRVVTALALGIILGLLFNQLLSSTEGVMDLSQYLGHILVETVMSFFLLPNLQTPEGLDSESNYEVDSGY
ncbi:hypothetical protein ACWOCJ_02105, partial [Enterococcus pseudoavium]